MSLKPITPEAYDLLMAGSIAMAKIEEAGIRIDMDLLDRSIKETTNKVKELESQVSSDPLIKLWQKHYGTDMKLTAPAQLGHMVFNILKEKRNRFLDPKSNEEIAFKHVNLPVVKSIFEIKRLKNKVLTTSLLGFKREIVDGYLHPFFSVHTTESYRSSSDRPNLHNIPIRQKEVARIIRSCIIPRPGHILLEADGQAQEVRGAACYNKDPQLIEYILGKGDMHADAAKDIFNLTDKELGGIEKGQPGNLVRYAAKNKFVFPEFYGSYYVNVAPDLWDSIAELDLKTAQGISLYEHLKSKGIKNLGRCDPEHPPARNTFEAFLKEREEIFWDRLKVYKQWKDDWWNLYQRQGGINTLTGFRMEGIFRRNQILCDPIQGSSFHMLLQSIIWIQTEMRKRKMKSKIVNQIHDSMVFDAHKKEVDGIIELVKYTVTKRLPRYWKWICVPLAIEFEASETNWFEKRKVA